VGPHRRVGPVLAPRVARLTARPDTSTAGRPPLVVIGGATATGKTALAVELAVGLNAEGRAAEVISADSRQVYRGLDIGTAKPTPAERQGVVHHGLDLVDPDAAFSVADFVRHAAAALSDIAGRGGMAVLAGGTGLWLRAIADGLDVDALPHDPVVRAQLEAELAENGIERSAARLQALAPDLAATTDLRNPRRVVRALEIATLAGDGPRPPAHGYPGPLVRIVLDVSDRDVHRARIAARAESQLEAGIVDEALRLRARWGEHHRAFSAIGYREAWALADGRTDRTGYLDDNVRRNVAFAKRQRTWFRADRDATIVDATDDSLEAVRALVDRLG
jgi:tRNA dimethylallyltransferase